MFALRSFADSYTQLLAFLQCHDAALAQYLHMDEDVGLAAIRSDEAIAFGTVKPFDHPREPASRLAGVSRPVQAMR